MILRPFSLRSSTLRYFQFPAAFVAGIAMAAAPMFGQAGRAVSVNAPQQAATQQAPFNGQVVEDVVARVNDQIISKSDYERAEVELDAEAKQRNLSPQEVEQRKKDLLRDLIDQQLLLSRGKEIGINADTELVRRLDEIRKQYHLNSMDDLQKAAEAQGVNYEDFRANIRNSIITQEVIRQEVGRRISITQAEVQKYYADHKAEFDRPEQVRLSEILVPTTGDEDAQVKAAETKANDVAAKLKAGGDFETLAKANSGGPTAAAGGDLGEFKRGQLAKVLEDQTFNLQAGQYTDPIRTKQGFVILKVTEHQAGGQASVKDVEPQIEEQIGMSKMNPALREYLTKLREDSYKVVRPGYIDTGASAHETLPTYSSYTPPSPKKKKHVERTRFRQTGRGRSAGTQTAAAGGASGTGGAPAGVPSLADVPQGAAPVAVAPAGTTGVAEGGAGAAPGAAASAAPAGAAAGDQAASAPAVGKKGKKSKDVASANATMKPGKKEKIRFGQAPRETLPTGARKEQDAGAGTTTAESSPNSVPGAGGTEMTSGAAPVGGTQVAANESNEANPLDASNEEKKKTRYTDRLKLPKEKKTKTKTVDPFAPSAQTPEETADRKVQSAPLGLAGDTSKKPKKPKPANKTRMTDELKKPAGQSTDQPGTQPGQGTDQQPPTAPPAAPAPAPATAPQPQQ